MKCDEKEVCKMYFEDNLKPIDIAKKFRVNKSTITRILQKDSRYTDDKLKRKNHNKEKHVEHTKKYIKAKRKIKQSKNNVDDLILKYMHNQASMEMSKGKKLSNMAYRNWNVSAFSYNEKKRRYEFKEKELGRSNDVPKYIKVEV